jgi:hypothetical protein
MRIVNPTLSTIQKRHPLVVHPLPPPPNTIMKRFTIHRLGGIPNPFSSPPQYRPACLLGSANDRSYRLASQATRDVSAEHPVDHDQAVVGAWVWRRGL